MVVAPIVVLPDELMEEILSWLPVKSLMRFRCVSKGWNSLIFHPSFVKLHLQRSPTNNQLLLTYMKEVLQRGEGAAAPCSSSRHRLFENLSPIFDLNYMFLDSCNGLVCMYRYFNTKDFTEFKFKFWNPATRILSEDSPPLRLRFKQNSMKYGFGYDDQSDTYKVVVLLVNIESLDWEAKVYCLGDTCWTSTSPCPALSVPPQFDGQVRIIRGEPNGQFVSGTLNWLSRRVMSVDFQWQRQTLTENELVIFSYDLNKETSEYFLMPDGITNVFNDLKLGALKGCLCLFHTHLGTSLVVWLMREFGDGKSWTQLLNINNEHLQFRNIPCYYTLGVLCSCENDNVFLLADSWNSVFFVCNKKNNTVHRVNATDTERRLPCFSYGYVESLVLPY